MNNYTFPAVFTKEKTGGYSVEFPDIDGCFTCGDDIEDAIFMAEDALALMLCEYEDTGTPIPTPSHIGKMQRKKNSYLILISSTTC